MFEFLFVIGIVLAFYGYSAMKNPNVWGDQGRDERSEERRVGKECRSRWSPYH